MLQGGIVVVASIEYFKGVFLEILNTRLCFCKSGHCKILIYKQVYSYKMIDVLIVALYIAGLPGIKHNQSYS